MGRAERTILNSKKGGVNIMLTRRKNAIWGRYPCCDLVNNAIRHILNGNLDSAISELLTAIIKADGYVHEDISEEANAANDRVWAKRNNQNSYKEDNHGESGEEGSTED